MNAYIYIYTYIYNETNEECAREKSHLYKDNNKEAEVCIYIDSPVVVDQVEDR